MEYIEITLLFLLGFFVGYWIFVSANRYYFTILQFKKNRKCLFHNWEKIGTWSKGEFNYKPILKCKVCNKRAPNDD